MIKNTTCPQCRKSLDTATEVNINTGLAKCNTCNIVIDLTTHEESRSSKLRDKVNLVDTSHFDIKRMGGSTEISFKWKTNWFLILFATF